MQLFLVHLLELSARRVRLAVRLNHPDACGLPASKIFALRLLYKDLHEFDDHGDFVPVQPLGHAMPEDVVYSEGGLSDSIDDFIASVTVSEIRNMPFSERAVNTRIGAELLSSGLSPDEPGWEDAWDECWDAWWQSDEVPSAVYEIEVTDPRWLAHLSPGQTWGSAAYDD